MTNHRDAMINDVLAFEETPAAAEATRRRQLEALPAEALAEIVHSHQNAQRSKTQPPAVRVVLLGPPASGKGTQGARIAARYGLPHLSTGEMLRAAVARGSDLGRRIAPAMETGELLDDGIVIAVTMERLWREDTRGGFVLDGFPRTMAQAKALDAHLASFHASLDAVIDITVDPGLILDRMASRAETARANGASARADDTPEVLQRRWEAYVRQTTPVVGYYKDRQGLYFEIDGAPAIDEVSAKIAEIIDGVVSECEKKAQAMPTGDIAVDMASPAAILDTGMVRRTSTGFSLTLLMGIALTFSVIGALLLNKLWK